MQGRISTDHAQLAGRRPSARLVRVRPLSRGAKVRLLLLANLLMFAAVGLVGEVACRLFWHPKYWLTAEGWRVGSGQSAAGKRWWPSTTYRVDSREFQVRFQTNARGYRARSSARPVATGRPYRIAFVGDSFVEAMQVDDDRTFVARLERPLAGLATGRPVVCENFGIAATGPFDYWHRIAHDVLAHDPPDAVVVCLYPGNDFTAELPEDGFEPDGRPRRDYFKPAGWGHQVLTWLNLKSKLAHLVLHSFQVAAIRATDRPGDDRFGWWSDPAKARRFAADPLLARHRALLRAIDEECRSKEVRLVALVLGPVPTYISSDGSSPLARIIADWGLEAPVIDPAALAIARPDWPTLLFPRDGHLNEAGHAYIAEATGPALRLILGTP